MGWNGANRRKFYRAKFPCMVKLTADSDQQHPFLTCTENIGFGGVSVQINQQLPVNAAVIIELDLMDGEKPVIRPGKVAWIRPHGQVDSAKTGLFAMGIELEQLNDADSGRVERIVRHLVEHNSLK